MFLFVLVAGFFGGPVAGSLESSGGFATNDADSVRAIEHDRGGDRPSPGPGIVLVVDTPDGLPADADRVQQVTEALAAEPGIDAGRLPDDHPRRARRAGLDDGTQVLVLGTLGGRRRRRGRSPRRCWTPSTVRTTSPSAARRSSDMQLGSTVTEDLGRAELLAFPILIVLSLIFFRGRGALIPLVVGVTTVLGTFLVLTGVNQLYGLSIFALNLVMGLGIGLAIDYTLFLLTRYREELASQGATAGAVLTTMRTAGRTVAFSASTVAVALAALTVFPLGFIKSMGLAGATVAVVAAVASLVIAPAMFGLWGAKLARKEPRRGAEHGRWYRLSHAVMRRPGAVAIATGMVMLALAAPALRAEWTPIDSSVIPTDKSARTVADTIETAFDGTGASPLTIAVTTSKGSGEAEVAEYADRVNALPGVATPGTPVRLDEEHVAAGRHRRGRARG